MDKEVDRLRSELSLMPDDNVGLGRYSDSQLGDMRMKAVQWASEPVRTLASVHDEFFFMAEKRRCEMAAEVRLDKAKDAVITLENEHPVLAWFSKQSVLPGRAVYEELAQAHKSLVNLREDIAELRRDPAIHTISTDIVALQHAAVRTGQETLPLIDAELRGRVRLSVFENMKERFGTAVFQDVVDIELVRTSAVVALCGRRATSGHPADVGWNELQGYNPHESIVRLADNLRAENDVGVLRSGWVHGLVDARAAGSRHFAELDPQMCAPHQAAIVEGKLNQVIARESVWGEMRDAFGDWLRRDVQNLHIAKTHDTVGLAAGRENGGPVWIDLSYIRGFYPERPIAALKNDFAEMVRNRDGVWQCGLGDELWSRQGQAKADALFREQDHGIHLFPREGSIQ